uniref:NADH-ubiquinone oxidoreductase chain 2 n=1 Tax=Paracheirodon innesi TaxID=42492 RepID=F7UJ12_9TELE|nr:NADH dehydrogenase subunit 2 [Paracheirodon innesi]AJW75300.1 NADH dehydrogenase subunit 2 [Paracheirodon innesi]ALN96899.1 NADH dehydrogenase subunit 2 [Paracheirodon innesi]BAK42226.1 NADH dehydrogenase subunit 2 [Paracheirodon innesi]
MIQTLYMVFIFSLGLGTTLTFASNHWLYAWIGVEISTFAIIPIMAQSHHPRAVEATVKYLLIQGAAAGLLLFGTILNAALEKNWTITELTHPFATPIVLFALVLKLGLAPCHYWVPEIMQGLNIKTGLILATWQKLAPFALFLQMSHTLQPWMPLSIGVLSIIAAGWAGMNQTQIRKILAYSSIAHLGWMVVVIQYAPNLAVLALVIYILSTLAAFLAMEQTSSTKINNLSQVWSKSPSMLTMMILVLLSLAGLPPLTGFLPKWLVLNMMVQQQMIIIAFVISMSSLLSLYFYLRLCYFSTLTVFPATTKISLHWRHQMKKQNITMATVATTSLILLPLAPLISALMLFYL